MLEIPDRSSEEGRRVMTGKLVSGRCIYERGHRTCLRASVACVLYIIKQWGEMEMCEFPGQLL